MRRDNVNPTIPPVSNTMPVDPLNTAVNRTSSSLEQLHSNDVLPPSQLFEPGPLDTDIQNTIAIVISFFSNSEAHSFNDF